MRLGAFPRVIATYASGNCALTNATGHGMGHPKISSSG